MQSYPHRKKREFDILYSFFRPGLDRVVRLIRSGDAVVGKDDVGRPQIIYLQLHPVDSRGLRLELEDHLILGGFQGTLDVLPDHLPGRRLDLQVDADRNEDLVDFLKLNHESILLAVVFDPIGVVQIGRELLENHMIHQEVSRKKLTVTKRDLSTPDIVRELP